MCFCNFANSFQVSFLRQDWSHISHHRLDDERCYVVIFGERLFEGFSIIVGNLPCCRSKLSRNTCRVRGSMSQRPASCGNQDRFMRSVKAPFDFYNLSLSGKPAGKTQSRQGCLGSGRDKPEHINGRIVRSYNAGKFNLKLGRCAEQCSAG